MRRTVLQCSFAICVFCVGIAGGHHLRSFLQRTPRAVRLETSPPLENVLANVPDGNNWQPVDDSVQPGILLEDLVDHEAAESDAEEHAVFITRVREIAASVPAELTTGYDTTDYNENSTDQSSAESASAPKFNPAKRAAIVPMILQFLPDLTTAEVNVWAEQLMDLSIDEAHFILQQKQTSQRSSAFASLPASLTTSLDQILAVEGSTIDLRGQAAQSSSLPDSNSTTFAAELNRAVEIVRSNLRGSNSPGFRGQRLILDASVQFTSGSPAVPAAIQLTTQTRFEYASAAFSGNPLHVSLPDDPQLMFQISPQRNAGAQDDECAILLTRRGTFSVLSNGQLGLQIDSCQFELVPRVVIPAAASRVWITSSAAVHCLTEDNNEVQCGQLPIIKVQTLSDLSTTDGLTFAANGNKQIVLADTANLVLQTESFELSNVDQGDEWLLMDHFRRLLKEIPGE